METIEKHMEMARFASGEHGMEWITQKENHKIYPNHSMECFRLWNDYTEEVGPVPVPHCRKCGGNPSANGNGSFYTVWIQYLSHGHFEVRCCPKCLEPGSMDFHNQMHGYREPVVFPEQLKHSYPHEVVFKSFLTGSTGYLIRDYLTAQPAKREAWYKKNISLTSWGGSGDEGIVWGLSGKIVYEPHTKKHKAFTLSRGEVHNMLDEILQFQVVVPKINMNEPGHQRTVDSYKIDFKQPGQLQLI